MTAGWRSMALSALALLCAACGGGAGRDGLSVVSAEARSGTLVIFLSGIAGWGGLERRTAEHLAGKGHAVVGLNSPDWFSQRRTPAEVAAHLASIIDAHAGPAGAERVVLAGYSFGANALPPAWNSMTASRQDAIPAVILIAPNRRAREIIDLPAILGLSRGRNDLVPMVEAMPKDRLACIYPEEEQGWSGCTLDVMQGARVVQLPGGHTFDGDAEAVADEVQAILAGLESG